MELTTSDWLLAGAACLVAGFTKTGISGIGMVAVVLMATAVPARASTGVILPLLLVGDVFAVGFYRRHASRTHLVRLLPWVLAGMGVGFAALEMVKDNALFGRILGAAVLVMLALYVARRLGAAEALDRLPGSRWFAPVSGVLAGFATAFGNAAGGIMSAYLLAMGFEKRQFMGTAAWFYLVVNLIKVPFYSAMGLITAETLLIDARLAGVVVAGALVGPAVLRLISQRAFEVAVLLLAAAGTIRLLVGPGTKPPVSSESPPTATQGVSGLTCRTTSPAGNGSRASRSTPGSLEMSAESPAGSGGCRGG